MRRILLIAVSALAVLTPSLALAAPAVAVAGLPSDPAAQGYIGFCDETGHNVTGGSIDTKPFIWKAVASTAPPAQYQGTGQNAVLNVYQPRPQVPPGEWSGLSITAASFYTSKPYPAVQSTYEDQSLADFMASFPPMVNGLYVLRMYYGKANFGLYNRTYPATTIQVVGTRWSVVSGGTVDCNAAKAVSNEQLTGVVTKKQFTARSTPPAVQTTAGATSGTKPAAISSAPVTAPSGSGSGAAVTGGAHAGADGLPSQAVAAAHHTSSSSNGWLWFVIVPVVVLLALAVLLRRRLASRPPSSAT